MRRCLWLGLVVSLSGLCALGAEPPPLELDLSPSASLKGVLVLPPVMAVQTGKKGAFVGVDTRKVVERYVLTMHQKLVRALDKRLGGKVLTADVAMGVLTREGVTPGALENPQVLARLAKVSGVRWVIGFSLNKTRLTARLSGDDGKVIHTDTLDDLTTLTEAQADSLASRLVPRLLELEKARLDAEKAAAPPVVVAPVLPPPEDDVVDAELEQLARGNDTSAWTPQRNRVRAVVAVGPGAALRDLSLAGETADTLAALDNGVVVGLGFNVQLMPLEFFDATAGKALSQLSLEVHYRRAIVHAQGVAGGLEGQTCTMADDDLQLRLGARYRLGEGYLPTIGVAGGWSQEQTHFDCNLPLLSTTWRGVDAQLRVRQPLFKDIVTLELIGGPRFLLAGPLASSPGFSLSAEAWLEVKPVSVLFARAGARFSRLQASTPGLAAIDTRTFLALELGAFF